MVGDAVGEAVGELVGDVFGEAVGEAVGVGLVWGDGDLALVTVGDGEAVIVDFW